LEFKALLSKAFSPARQLVKKDISAGWRVPDTWLEQLKSYYSQPSDAILSGLFEKFCEEVSFPENWTLVHKSMVFSNLITSLNKIGHRSPK
jgi:hypothetical protein